MDFGFPDIEGVEYLLDLMGADGLGWCSQDAMGGVSPLSWLEITSFSQGAGLDLEPWEARQIRVMSVAYIDGMTRGREPMRVSPVFADRPDEDPGVAVERRRVSDGLKAGMMALISSKSSPG